jgi:uncharacterized repeat protein (TIGR03803 family)
MLQGQPDSSKSVQRIRAMSFLLMGVFLLLASVSETAQSQTYNVIHNFTNKGKDGATPYGGPILDGEGNLYGTTYLGGIVGAGSVYRLSPNGSSWEYTSLYSFKAGTDGSGPAFASLAVGPGPALYGTTEGGGSFGIAFSVGPQVGCSGMECKWGENVVHNFGTGTDGAQPIGGLVFDSAGNFYGTTSLGGTYGNGIVFKGARSGKTWTESILYNFTGGTDGTNPPSGVTLDTHGNLYGTTSFGGAYGTGEVYELSPSASGWTETVLYNFQGLSDGEFPVGGVVLDASGNIYGGTFLGGDNNGGTIYELSPSSGGWTLKTLYSFSGGAGPYNKLTFDAKGNIYSFTNGDGANGLGSVFKLTPSSTGWTFTDLYDFIGGNEGSLPYGSVAVDADGNVFGTAAVGGTDNQGVVFEITP